MAILSLVGKRMRHAVGIAGRMFTTLGGGGVNIEMISQGANEINISCVIDGRDAVKALNLIHQSCLHIAPAEATRGRCKSLLCLAISQSLWVRWADFGDDNDDDLVHSGPVAVLDSRSARLRDASLCMRCLGLTQRNRVGRHMCSARHTIYHLGKQGLQYVCVFQISECSRQRHHSTLVYLINVYVRTI